MSISPLLLSCLGTFTKLGKLVSTPSYERYESEVLAAAWIDELGRLRIWAANVGAHQSSQSSLDFRLRDASHIRNQVVKLLTSLKRLLDKAIEYLSAESHDDDSLLVDEALDEDPLTELQGIFEELIAIVQCLYMLAIAIRNPTQHDFLEESYRSDTTAFEPFYQQHVREKFPKANEELILRLTKAMTRRRGYLKYRERHSVKLSKGLENADTGAAVQQLAGTISETIASSVQPQSIGIKKLSCPLCMDNLATTKQFERHIARHLEELALFVLPRVEDGSEDEVELRSEDASSDTDSEVAKETIAQTNTVRTLARSELFEKPNLDLQMLTRSIQEKKKPIRFKDAVGRKFSFPFHLCNTWDYY
ncbi:MAG: hypothetical protein Q9223_004209 [Gallowayella weberi]